MRVLVTGHRGYIGSVLTPVLRHAHYEVAGLDCDLYADCDFGRVREELEAFDCDIREIESADLLPFDAVVHLAALPDDANGAIPEKLIEEVNVVGTQRLLECCKQAGVARFVFASSCAVYGSRAGEWLDEESAVRPITTYAKSKLLGETILARSANAGFQTTPLRLGTVYGMSPRMRLDTVVNDFTAAALTTGRITMATEGWGWRPFVHIQDVCRAILAVLQCNDGNGQSNVFNLVNSAENCRVMDVADAVVEEIPYSMRFHTAGELDRLSYRVNGSKLLASFPQFRWRYGLRDGLRQMRAAFDNAGLTRGDWRTDRYRRALRLQRLRDSGRFELGRTPGATVAA